MPEAAPGVGAEFAPPRWLRSAHVQSVLGTSAWRRRRGALQLASTGALTTSHILDGGDGVRLQGQHSAVPGLRSRGLVLLLHGWEGSSDSSYMALTGAHLLQRGFEVFRLNFRDHGDSHHLNRGLFHSNLIDEVVHAARDLAQRFPARPMLVGGYSLGGNFALRVGLRAPAAGLSLAGVAAVCPVLDPDLTLARMEQGLPLYLRHFEAQWRRSLRRKRDLFPDLYRYDDATLKLGMRRLTEQLVLENTAFGSLDAYFDGYSIAGDRLSALQPPAWLLTSEDDPVIPVEGFRALQLPARSRLEIAPWGGHCGFIENARLDGYAERWMAARLEAAATGAG